MAETQVRTISPRPSEARHASVGEQARRQLLASMPVTERRLQLAGISTAVLEGGEGPPVVLLHGPGAYAAHWLRVIPDLVTSHRVVAPDLPGHGASDVADGALDADRVLDWLEALIDRTSESPPALVGELMAGAIAARFASDRGLRLTRLVLADTFGLSEFQPTPAFGLALTQFLAQPTEETHRALWRHCAFDLDRLRQRMGEIWQPFETYNLACARRPSQEAALSSLMQHFGLPLIPGAELARITVPTTLIWGRHDRATPLSIAEAASVRYRWPLEVIEDSADDPSIEQPEAFLRALRSALGSAQARAS